VSGIFERTGKDWESVAGEFISEADTDTVKALAGLNPNNPVQRAKIRKALGLSVSVIGSVEPATCDRVDEDADLEEEARTDEAEGDVGIPFAFKEVDTENRVKIYRRMVSLRRALLSLPIVTSKKKTYGELNTIVCHVSIRPYTLLMKGLDVGEGLEYHTSFESARYMQEPELLS